MKIKTKVRAGKLAANHNQAIAGLKVRSHVKAGGVNLNHNQAVVG